MVSPKPLWALLEIDASQSSVQGKEDAEISSSSGRTHEIPKLGRNPSVDSNPAQKAGFSCFTHM